MPDNKIINFKQFWNHPLVQVKQQSYFGFKPVSYLSAHSFSTVILDLLTQKMPISTGPAEKIADQTLGYIRQLVVDPTTDKIDVGALKDIITPLLKRSSTLEEFKKSVETWYDGYMEQVSGWYKRYTQIVVWAVGIAVTLLFNIDTVRITNRVFTDKTLRANLVADAEQTAHRQTGSNLFRADTVKSDSAGKPKIVQIRRIPKDSLFNEFLAKKDSSLAAAVMTGVKLTPRDSLSVQDAYLQFLHEKIDSLGLPIGWEFGPKADLKAKVSQFFSMLFSLVGLGWVLTATALSFGAPFWFDLLLKIVNIRNVARKPLSSVQPN